MEFREVPGRVRGQVMHSMRRAALTVLTSASSWPRRRDGKVVKRYAPTVPPKQLVKDVEAL